MRDRPVINGEGAAVADADRLDAARRVLLADYCRLVARRLNGTPSPAAATDTTDVAAPAAIGAIDTAETQATIDAAGPSDFAGIAGQGRLAEIRRTVVPPTPRPPASGDAMPATATADSPVRVMPVESAGATGAAIAALALPRRLEQTLVGLLAGRSEKQVARDLTISPHTVHTYVKELHKRLGVNSRGELLARFISRDR